jgi:signal transduction histidine kinase
VPTYPALTANLLSLLLITGAVFLEWRAGRTLLVSIVVCTGFALVGATLARRGLPVGPFGLALVVLLVGAAVAVASAHILERSRAELAEREHALADLSTHLMTVQEEERRHLARELHEELGQSMTAMLSYLWLIENRDAHDIAAIHSDAAAARTLGSQTLAEMRRLSQGLRPTVLDVCGLVPALETYVKSFGEREHIATRFAAKGLPERLPTHLEVGLYRVTQEALGNVARHAGASHVEVDLALQGAELRLEVHDDGVGLETRKDTPNGHGLVAIGERARALGGSVGVDSARGTHLTVRIPISPRGVDPDRDRRAS